MRQGLTKNLYRVPEKNVTIEPRVGLNTVPEPWLSKPWRFLVKGWKIDLSLEE